MNRAARIGIIAISVVIFCYAGLGHVLGRTPDDKAYTHAGTDVGSRDGSVLPGDAVAVSYVAAPDGNVYALRSADGSTVWTSKVADGTPLI